MPLIDLNHLNPSLAGSTLPANLFLPVMKTSLLPCFLVLSLVAFAQPEVPREIDRLAGQYVGNPHNRGLIIGVVRPGNQTVKAYGETGKGKRQVPRPDDIFELGELSGVFTATLLAKMHREGLLSLDAPLDSVMPAGLRMPVYQQLKCEPSLFSNPDRPGPGVYVCEPQAVDNLVQLRLCDVATHVSGLPRYPSNQPFRNRRNPFARYTRTDLYTFLNNYPIRVSKRFGYQYSYVGMALAGEALTSRATRTYEEVLTEKMLRPLGMNHTGIRLNAAQENGFLTGHNRLGKPVPHWETDVMAPAAGIRSSVSDLIELLRMHIGLTDDEWFYAARLTQNPRVPVTNPAHTYAGLGWLITLIPETKEEIIWQAGQTGGFSVYMGLIPESGIGVVVLSNSANSVAGTGQDMLRLLNRTEQKPTHLQSGISR
jgi:CubicO group peptidase (beta-lactamase class C family)